MDWIGVIVWLVGTLVVVLGPMILIHELGHFCAAKLAGVRVEEFGIGLPPRLLKVWRQKGFAWIGGTRFEVDRGSRLPYSPVSGSWVEATGERQPDGKLRLVQMKVLDPQQAGPATELHEVAQGMQVRGELAEYEPGTLYSLNALPLGAFVKMTGEEDPADPRSLASKPRAVRIGVRAAGALLNLLAALLILAGAYTTGLPTQWQVRIAAVVPGTAAEEAGLLADDLVTAINDVPLTEGTDQLHAAVVNSAGQELTLTVQRGKELVTLAATPRRDEDGNALLGIMMDAWPGRDGREYYGLSRAFSSGARDLWDIVVAMASIPAMLIRGQVTAQEVRPTSLVGIGSVLTFSLQRSIIWRLPFPALQTAAMISLALGLTNLLPLPMLDGGRILFVIIEAIRGRRIPPEREAVVHFVGLMVLVALMVILMFQDIVNPIIPWSWLKW